MIQKVKVLFVDDEELVLESLARHVRRVFEVRTASSGAAALELLERENDVAVIVSDMRMPVMDGPTFLGKARVVAPDAVCMVLSGQAQLDAAISAVNNGRLFRFLTKPCPPGELINALASAAEQHRLVLAERELLEKTLHGCMRGLTEILALSNPAAFGCATRVRAYAGGLAERLNAPDRWQIELAAMLAHVAAITLPPATAERHYNGGKLGDGEDEMVERLPTVAAHIVADVPRLDGVRDILFAVQTLASVTPATTALKPRDLPIGARILRAAIDCDALEARGAMPDQAVAMLRAGKTWYDPDVLDALERMAEAKPVPLRDVPVRDLRAGMILGADLKTRAGALLVSRGYELTQSSLARLKNFAATVGIAEPVRIKCA